MNSLMSNGIGTNFVLAEGGQATINYGSTIEKAVLGIVLALLGLALIIVGARDIFLGLKDAQKDWKQVILGILSLIVGGLFMAFSVGTFINMSQNMGNDIKPA